MKTLIPTVDVVFQENCATHGVTEHYIILQQYLAKHHVVQVKFWCVQCVHEKQFEVHTESWHIDIWKDFMKNINTVDN